MEYLIDESSKNIYMKHMGKILFYQKHIVDLGTHDWEESSSTKQHYTTHFHKKKIIYIFQM